MPPLVVADVGYSRGSLLQSLAMCQEQLALSDK